MKKTLLFACMLFISTQLFAQFSEFVTGITTPVGAVLDGNTMYVGSIGDSKIVTVDVTDPNPTPQDFLTGISFPGKFLIIGSNMYLTYGTSSIGRIDLTAPSPTITPLFTGLSFPYDLVQNGNFIYVSLRNSGEIVRFDYTQTNPTLVPLLSNLGTFLGGLAFYGDELYIARGGDYIISKIDVSATNPSLIDVIEAEGPNEVTINNSYLYFANNYLNRIDLTNPSANVEVVVADFSDAIWEILFDEDIIYLVQQLSDRILSADLNTLNFTSNPDYDALVEFYNALDGPNWNNNTNWLDQNQSISSWHGIGVETVNGVERVKQITLHDNNLSGMLPPSVGDLTYLESLSLIINNITGIPPIELVNLPNIDGVYLGSNSLSGVFPNFSGMSSTLSIFAIERNNFNFSDLEPNLAANTSNSFFFSYSPQLTTDQVTNVESLPGNDITLDIDATNINRNSQDESPNNVYQWFKDDVAITGANATTYTIVNAQESDSGIYHCEVTNPLVPSLTIERADITVVVDENLSTEDFEDNGFKIYPNPASNVLHIKTKVLNNASMRLFNTSGQLLFEKPMTSDITSVAIDELASGMYIIQLNSDNFNHTTRFIKQ